jgi:hypothetical protein
MEHPQPAKTSPTVLLRRLLACLSYDWVVPLFDLLNNLRRTVAYGRHEGMYEFLLYDATLDLHDPTGRTATFRKHQRVKFPHPTNKLPRIRRRVGRIGSQSLTRCTFFSDADFAC